MADYLSQFTGSEIDSRLAKVPQLETGKQDKLTSGTNIKTINGQSVLGSGNLQIQTGETDVVKYTAQTLTEEQKAQARANIDAASLEDINNMDFVTAASLPTASASTMGHIYLIGPDENDNYDRYFTQQDGSSYSWVSLGSTQIDLSTYATKSEVDQLETKVKSKIPLVQEDGFYIADEGGNVVVKYTSDGFDVAKLSHHLLGMLQIVAVNEPGYFFVDEELRIGAKIDGSGLQAKTTINYVIE